MGLNRGRMFGAARVVAFRGDSVLIARTKQHQLLLGTVAKHELRKHCPTAVPVVVDIQTAVSVRLAVVGLRRRVNEEEARLLLQLVEDVDLRPELGTSIFLRRS